MISYLFVISGLEYISKMGLKARTPHWPQCSFSIFRRKLPPLKVPTAHGLNFSFRCQTREAATPLVNSSLNWPRFLVLAHSLGLSLLLCLLLCVLQLLFAKHLPHRAVSSSKLWKCSFSAWRLCSAVVVAASQNVMNQSCSDVAKFFSLSPQTHSLRSQFICPM